MNRPRPKKSPEELRAERRRERLKAFFVPFITMGSIVVSVAMIMALLKSCSERLPPTP